MKRFFKKNKRLFILVFVVLILAISLLLVRQNQNINEDAAGVRCSDQKSYRECVASCSPVKSGKSYGCKWAKNKCIESSKECVKPTPSSNIIYCNSEYKYSCILYLPDRAGYTHSSEMFECIYPEYKHIDGVYLCCPKGKYARIPWQGVHYIECRD